MDKEQLKVMVKTIYGFDWREQFPKDTGLSYPNLWRMTSGRQPIKEIVWNYLTILYHNPKLRKETQKRLGIKDKDLP